MPADRMVATPLDHLPTLQEKPGSDWPEALLRLLSVFPELVGSKAAAARCGESAATGAAERIGTAVVERRPECVMGTFGCIGA